MHILFFVLETAKDLAKDVWAFLSSEAGKNFAETLAILIGGGWAFSRFILRRESKPALEISLTTKIIPETEGLFLTSFDVTLTNKSTRRVLARKRKQGQPAWEDRNERLQHSCSLLLRRVAEGAQPDTQVRWFPDADARSPLSTDIVVNLLDEYEYEVEGRIPFWMEPSESSPLCVGVMLQPGVYLAMVTFVGRGGCWERLFNRLKNWLNRRRPFKQKPFKPKSDEFWRRMFIVQIPERDTLPS